MNLNSSPNDARQTTQVLTDLPRLLAQHAHERVIVVGTTCTGKSTMLATVTEGRDQDAEVFPKLTSEESAYVCQVPWTPDIGKTMVRLVRERVKSEIGKPLFGTVVVDADFVILLKISDDLLKERVASRNVRFQDAKNMQAQIEEEVRNSGIPWIEFRVG